MELWQAYKTVRRRWLLVLVIALVGTLLGMASGLAETRQYRATATLNTGVNQANEWNGQNPRVADKQALLTSTTLLQKVDDKLGLGGQLERLENAIRVARIGESTLLRVDVRWSEPNRARDIANSLLEEFVSNETERLKNESVRDIRLLQEQADAARERLRRAQTVRLTAGSADASAAEEELAQARQTLSSVTARMDLARATVTNPAAANTMTIVDRATVPAAAEASTANRTILFGGLIGLFLGLVVAVGLEYVDGTPRLLETLRTDLGVSILAVVPWERHFERRFYPALNKLSAGRREAFRLLRSNLMLKRRTVAPLLHERFATRPLSAPLVVMVSSDRPDSGCSSVAVNLGVSLANAGQRALLIDANLIDPTLHRFAQRAPTPGLNDWLIDPHRNPEELVQPTDLNNLFLMAAGGANPAASDLLAERNVTELVRSFTETYDAIIVDSPALSGSSDARLLSEAVDGVVIVLRPNGNDAEVRARHAVRFAGDKLLGVVLNALNLEMGLMAGLASPPPALAPAGSLATGLGVGANGHQAPAGANGNGAVHPVGRKASYHTDSW